MNMSRKCDAELSWTGGVRRGKRFSFCPLRLCPGIKSVYGRLLSNPPVTQHHPPTTILCSSLLRDAVSFIQKQSTKCPNPSYKYRTIFILFILIFIYLDMYSNMLLQSHRRILTISTHGLVVCESVRDECVFFFCCLFS